MYLVNNVFIFSVYTLFTYQFSSLFYNTRSPGPIDVSNCVAKWSFKPKAWQLASKMEILIHQQDQYGNLVPGLYAFDAEIVERDTNLSIPVADLQFKEVEAGIQLFSFSNSEPGNFFLTIYNSKHNKSISEMPYAYTVYIGKIYVPYLVIEYLHFSVHLQLFYAYKSKNRIFLLDLSYLNFKKFSSSF